MKGLLEAAYMLILTGEVCLPPSCASPGRAARLGSASRLADPRDLLLAVAGHEIPLQSSVAGNKTGLKSSCLDSRVRETYQLGGSVLSLG